jgi:hypothetical protein
VQREKNINVKEGEKRINEYLKKLHLQRRKWKHDSKNALC